jgi:hypothetical protein
MAEEFSAGDRVSWNTPQGRTKGRVKRKLTSRTWIGDHEIAASTEEPQYLVESEKSGARAAHKAGALRKLKDR